MRADVSEIAAYSSRYLLERVKLSVSFISISQIRIFQSKNTHTRNFCSSSAIQRFSVLSPLIDIEVTSKHAIFGSWNWHLKESASGLWQDGHEIQTALYFARYFGLQHKPSSGTERKKEGLCCKPKYRANLFKYILVVLAILSFVTSAIRISLPSVFCILDILLMQVYKRSGTIHRFVAVVLQILIVYDNWGGPLEITGEG